VKPYHQIITKRPVSMAQAVDHLPSKCEFLSSNPRSAKKRKEEKTSMTNPNNLEIDSRKAS
jgi:hypothetical protein